MVEEGEKNVALGQDAAEGEPQGIGQARQAGKGSGELTMIPGCTWPCWGKYREWEDLISLNR